MRSLIFICLIFLLHSCQSPQKIDYYLPQNFQGQVAIIFSNTGDSTIDKNDRQQVIIPESGIIFLNQKPFFGEVDYKYYIKTSNGVTEIDRYLPGITANDKEKYILSEESKSGLLKGKKGLSVYYDSFEFYVGKKLDTATSRERFYFSRHLDSIIINHN